jgi:hypothetical protein
MVRGILLGLALLGLASPAAAGVYNTLESYPNLPPEKVPSYVRQLRGIAVPPKGPLDPGSMRAAVLQLTAKLEADQRNGTLSTVDRINLGACYIRLGQHRDAIRLLSAGDQRHFLIQANLASAYFLNGDLEVALRHQQRALDLWPVVWATWRPGQVLWYRQCERIFLRLLTARQAAGRLGRNREPDLDPIFGRVKFVGPSGEYEAGQVTREVLDQLPPNAYGITLQLAMWYPQDWQLYWLLAELLNASGEVIPAAEMIVEMVDSNVLPSRVLLQHRKVLLPAAKLQETLRSRNNYHLLLSIFAAVPSGTLPPPGVGAIAHQGFAAMPLAIAPLANQPPVPPVPPSDSGTQAATPFAPRQPPFSWQHVTVAFVFGFLVAALLAFQWQEWRRRRLMQQAALDPLEANVGADSAKQEVAETNVKPGGPSSSVRPGQG